MKLEQPQFIIAGTGSGVGKTSISLGISAALRKRKLNVQTFKIGPDYLDPTYLKLASGNSCYNLDSWMCSSQYISQLFHNYSSTANVAIVEGVMGLFDGADPCSIEGSTAEISTILDLPVILVVNAHGCARSIAAIVKGFCELEANVKVAGVIANHVGSERHVEWLHLALETAQLPPLVGAIPRDSLPKIPSRHLGLKSANNKTINTEFFSQLAIACETHIDIDRLLKISANPVTICKSEYSPKKVSSTRIAVANDEAFHFTYPDNLKLLEDFGAEICYFSPLSDENLPENISGIYLPGGYPEVFAEQLSKNCNMITSIKTFAKKNRPIYAECGGLMYLGESISCSNGTTIALCNILPIQTTMLEKRKMLGYTEVTLQKECLLGKKGDVIRGHEFHYSEITVNNAKDWNQPYSVTRRRKATPIFQGFSKGNILASYVHLHWGSNPQTAQNFVNKCKGIS